MGSEVNQRAFNMVKRKDKLENKMDKVAGRKSFSSQQVQEL